MNWIKERIDREYRKHKDLDWSMIASIKIKNQIRDIIKDLEDDGYLSADNRDSLFHELKLFDEEICKKCGMPKSEHDGGYILTCRDIDDFSRFEPIEENENN